VALHAITDAVLGAIAMATLERISRPAMRNGGPASHIFLAMRWGEFGPWAGCRAYRRHADLRIPKIGPYRDAMRADRRNRRPRHWPGRLKATTSERLGFTGRGEGIACLASATLRLPWRDRP